MLEGRAGIRGLLRIRVPRSRRSHSCWALVLLIHWTYRIVSVCRYERPHQVEWGCR